MPDICFLNVVLDLESKASLAPIVAEFAEDVIVLHEGSVGTRGFAG